MTRDEAITELRDAIDRLKRSSHALQFNQNKVGLAQHEADVALVYGYAALVNALPPEPDIKVAEPEPETLGDLTEAHYGRKITWTTGDGYSPEFGELTAVTHHAPGELLDKIVGPATKLSVRYRGHKVSHVYTYPSSTPVEIA